MRRLLAPMVVLLSLLAACGGDSTGDAETGGLAAEPMPSLDELQTAADCDTLNRMIAGVENESFRANADLTVVEAQTEAGESGFVAGPHFEAFSDRQAELGCSDSVMMSVLEQAQDERCRAWLDEGHSLDEDPLLANTAMCTPAGGG